MTVLRLILLATAIGAISPAALAASSEPAVVEGGTVRIVTEGLPDEAGILRGALEIELNPGWKTYWRDPGESGIPPTVSVRGANGEAPAEIGFPAPARFNEGFTVFVGYDRPVALALTFELPPGGDMQTLETSVFLGICEDICIPVQADLTIDLNRSAAPDSEIVAKAFAALPSPAEPEFGASLRKAGKSNIIVDTALPAGAVGADLFLVSTEDWAFGTPKRIENAGTVSFDIPILMAPETKSMSNGIDYTLTAGERAVSGTFEINR